MPNIPTDLEILSDIHDHYHATYIAAQTNPAVDDKIHVSVDLERVAERVSSDAALLFGRLYYHLEQKYGYQHEGTFTRVAFFTPVAGQQRNCVNFPYMTSVLASLQDEDRKYTGGRNIAIAALCVSCVAVAISFLVGMANLVVNP